MLFWKKGAPRKHAPLISLHLLPKKYPDDFPNGIKIRDDSYHRS
jgi:hypothetical protein